MITSPVCWFLLFIYVFSSVAILNVKPVLCLCVSPLSSSVLLSDKKCENWKAKNNIKKARLAPWWKAVMTMDEWERRERVCVCVCVCVCVGGNKKEWGQMDSDRTALSSTFTACVSGIEPITGGTGAEDLGRKQLCSFHKKKKKKKKGTDSEIWCRNQRSSDTTSFHNCWLGANTGCKLSVSSCFSAISVRGGSVLTVFLLLSRFELKIRHSEATLLKRKALGKTEPSPQNETAELKLDTAAPAESRASDTTRPNDCPFFFSPVSLDLSTAARWQTH